MKSKNWKCGTSLALALAFASPAAGTIRFSEMLINSPGGDNGFEFIELASSAGGVEVMTGLTLLTIDGDGGASGVIDQALSLNTFSTGTNGLFLWRDAASALNPAPDAATSLNVADFNPDLENGTNTFLIVAGFTGALSDDLDTNDDGALDATPWTSVLDALSFVEDDGPENRPYANQLGGVTSTQTGWTPDAFVLLPNGTAAFLDVLGDVPGPFTADPLENTAFLPATFELTPGSANPVPEPSTFVLAGMALAGWLAVRCGRRS